MKFFAFVLISIVSFYATVQASNYPLDYSINQSCQVNESIQVCRALQPASNLAVLDIEYKGRLLNNSSMITLWIKVNYSNGSKSLSIPLTKNNHDQLGARITGGCLKGSEGGCALNGTAEMRNFLEWAQRSEGTLNQLNLEVAFYNENGEWDNLGSFKNYSFVFEEQRNQ